MAIISPRLRAVLFGVAAVASVAGADAAVAPTLSMLDGLEKGSWQLKDRESGVVLRSICLGEPRALIQIRHGRAECSRYVIGDEAGSVTVHYTCPGAGHGRTSIRRETARLVQIDTQGIENGAPFSLDIEGRRVGTCPVARR